MSKKFLLLSLAILTCNMNYGMMKKMLGGAKKTAFELVRNNNPQEHVSNAKCIVFYSDSPQEEFYKKYDEYQDRFRNPMLIALVQYEDDNKGLMRKIGDIYAEENNPWLFAYQSLKEKKKSFLDIKNSAKAIKNEFSQGECEALVFNSELACEDIDTYIKSIDECLEYIAQGIEAIEKTLTFDLEEAKEDDL